MLSSSLQNGTILTPTKGGMSKLSLDAVDEEKAPSGQSHPDGDIDGVLDRTGNWRSHSTPAHTETRSESYFRRFEDQLIKYNLEARGIQRVEPHECHALTWKSYVQIFLMWFSINLVAVNITLGMLAPTLFTLSFKDAALCAAFGAMLGSVAVAYIATWGPISGNRTLVEPCNILTAIWLTCSVIDFR